ncbi:MAG: helix-turn-helix domain-containing protein [Sodalis sp. (in: enterobacteria)]
MVRLLRQARISSGISQQQLGGALNCPQSLIAKVESG